MYRNSFQDLHPTRFCQSRPIRLLAEDGNSLAGGHERPVSIDTIQLTQACSSEAHHLVHRSAARACSMFAVPANALFSVISDHGPEFDRGSIPAVVRARLVQQGCQLADDARVEILQFGRSWVIRDQVKKYLVKKCSTGLAVYPGES